MCLPRNALSLRGLKKRLLALRPLRFLGTRGKIFRQAPLLEMGRSDYFVYMTVAIPVQVEDVLGKIRDGERE